VADEHRNQKESNNRDNGPGARNHESVGRVFEEVIDRKTSHDCGQQGRPLASLPASQADNAQE
jgi:hypothetical protein